MARSRRCFELIEDKMELFDRFATIEDEFEPLNRSLTSWCQRSARLVTLRVT